MLAQSLLRCFASSLAVCCSFQYSKYIIYSSLFYLKISGNMFWPYFPYLPIFPRYSLVVLCQIHVMNIFPAVVCLFTLLNDTFDEIQFLVSFVVFDFCILTKKPLPTSRSQNIFLRIPVQDSFFFIKTLYGLYFLVSVSICKIIFSLHTQYK